MKVITTQTMQELDRRAIEEHGIPGRVLMENAGRGCAELILELYGDRLHLQRVVILCGKGNNGGDGYVIARHLLAQGVPTQVIVLAEQAAITGDALTQLELLPAEAVSFCTSAQELRERHAAAINQASLLVDALLGTGLSANLNGSYLTAVELLNNAPATLVAVDIPSGIHGTTGQVLGQAVQADLTVSFAFAKLGHLLYPGVQHTGRLEVVDIGLPKTLVQQAGGYEFLNRSSVAPLLQPRERQAHKGTCGHCLIVAGATGKTGAAALAANSAVRAGAGLVTLAIPASLNPILEIKTTEAMTAPLADNGCGHLSEAALPQLLTLLAGKQALAVGPGIDRAPATFALVRALLEQGELPLVLDADALNAVAEDISVLRRARSQQVVLTPHPGEMARLLGTGLPDQVAERIAVAQKFAQTHGVHLILKGARTIVAAPDGRIAINGSGNPGMASGGTGDVLTGVIAALLAQRYPIWQACCLAVFLHGLSGDLVAADKGEIGMHAGDISEQLPYAFKHLLNTPGRKQLFRGHTTTRHCEEHL